MPESVTLGHLADAGADVHVVCWSCHRHSTLPLAPLLDRYGRGQPLLALSSRCVCSACGARRAEIRPAWPAITGEIARHDPLA